MRLLDRYLLRELLTWLGMCLCGFVIIYVAFDLIRSLNHIQEQELQFSDVLELYIVKIPEILAFIVPVALLLAMLYVLTNHARHHELTAMRAAGISLWRICLPYFVVGFLLSLAVFAMNEYWVPDSEAKQALIMDRRMHGNNPAGNAFVQIELGFANQRDGHIWDIGAYDFKTDTMTNPQVYWLDHGTNWHLMAKSAERVDGVWTFSDAKVFSTTDRMETNLLAMPEFTETPREFANEAKFNNRFTGKLSADSAEVPIREIVDYLAVHPKLPVKYQSWLRTQLHGRIAGPWACVVVVLIAIPFGAASGRRNIFMGVAGSIVICFVYFILLRLGLALGTGGFLPAWIAAWLPNAVFGITAFWLMLRVR